MWTCGPPAMLWWFCLVPVAGICFCKGQFSWKLQTMISCSIYSVRFQLTGPRSSSLLLFTRNFATPARKSVRITAVSTGISQRVPWWSHQITWFQMPSYQMAISWTVWSRKKLHWWCSSGDSPGNSPGRWLRTECGILYCCIPMWQWETRRGILWPLNWWARTAPWVCYTWTQPTGARAWAPASSPSSPGSSNREESADSVTWSMVTQLPWRCTRNAASSLRKTQTLCGHSSSHLCSKHQVCSLNYVKIETLWEEILFRIFWLGYTSRTRRKKWCRFFWSESRIFLFCIVDLWVLFKLCGFPDKTLLDLHGHCCLFFHLPSVNLQICFPRQDDSETLSVNFLFWNSMHESWLSE